MVQTLDSDAHPCIFTFGSTAFTLFLSGFLLICFQFVFGRRHRTIVKIKIFPASTCTGVSCSSLSSWQLFGFWYRSEIVFRFSLFPFCKNNRETSLSHGRLTASEQSEHIRSKVIYSKMITQILNLHSACTNLFATWPMRNCAHSYQFISALTI